MEIGANLAKKHGENSKVVNAILVHHGEGDPVTVEAALVAAADALSAARPGVRRESIEHYLKRLEALEQMALSFSGVDKCYAIQAGREIRIIVKPEDVNDEMSSLIARDLSKKLNPRCPIRDRLGCCQGIQICRIRKIFENRAGRKAPFVDILSKARLKFFYR
jgi:HD superfamily phosphodiesterase